MRLALAAALALGVAACGVKVERTPEQVACEAQSNDDPVVRALIMKGAGSTQFQEDNQEQLKQARAAAVRSCLERRGLVRPGGVERQKPL